MVTVVSYALHLVGLVSKDDPGKLHCRCEIPGKPESTTLSTPAVPETSNPVWNYEGSPQRENRAALNGKLGPKLGPAIGNPRMDGF